MKTIWKILSDWLSVEVQRKQKNSLLFLSMSFYLTVKGNMNSQEFIVVGLSILGIYVFGNIASKKVGNQTNDKTKGGSNSC